MFPNLKIYLTVDCLINIGADVLYSFFVLELFFFGVTIGLFYHSYFMRDGHNRERVSAELPIFKELERTLVKGEQFMGGEKVTVNLEFLGIALIDYVVETRARGQIYVQTFLFRAFIKSKPNHPSSTRYYSRKAPQRFDVYENETSNNILGEVNVHKHFPALGYIGIISDPARSYKLKDFLNENQERIAMSGEDKNTSKKRKYFSLNLSEKSIFVFLKCFFVMLSIGVLGFIIWAHFIIYTVGLGVDTKAYFAAATMIIIVSTCIKIFGWIVILWRGSIQLKTFMLFAIGSIFLFTLGGVNGVFLANSAIDPTFYDTYCILLV